MVEPRAVKILVMAAKTRQPTVFCCVMQYFEPCVEAEVSAIDNFECCFAEDKPEDRNCKVATVQSVNLLHCSFLTPRKKVPYQEVYIRPLRRLYPKDINTSFEHKPYQPTERRLRAKTEKPATIIDVPKLVKPILPKFQSTESNNPKIKFSTSTALYTPTKPSYGSYQTNHFRSAYLTNRAKSEFGERRSYVSLYS